MSSLLVNKLDIFIKYNDFILRLISVEFYLEENLSAIQVHVPAEVEKPLRFPIEEKAILVKS